MKKFLVKHVGNMGDLVILAPPVLDTIKTQYPSSHLTFVTPWGYKNRAGQWGKRNQGGHGIHLMMTNPRIDQLIHYHSTATSLTADICREDGQSFPTWSDKYFHQQVESGDYDQVINIDIGLTPTDHPVQKIYRAHKISSSIFNYQIYLTSHDLDIARQVIENAPHPRIVLLESLSGPAARSWDPAKVTQLESAITEEYGTQPIWFGAGFVNHFQGRPLTLRENIATLTFCDVGIGVLSGPLHFAAAVGLPTLTLYSDQPLHRAAPSYVQNALISNPHHKHRNILGPTPATMYAQKYPHQVPNLTPAETAAQKFTNWMSPGRQSTKGTLAAITVDEVLTVLHDMLLVPNL